MAPITTDLVELRHLGGGAFALQVGHNIVHVGPQAIADLLALLNLPQYADGAAGQCVHGYREHEANPVTHPAYLVAHIGAYDRADKAAADLVASEPYRAPAAGHKPNPNHLTLAVTTTDRTYVASMTRRDALQLIATATRRMGDAA